MDAALTIFGVEGIRYITVSIEEGQDPNIPGPLCLRNWNVSDISQKRVPVEIDTVLKS